MPRVAVVKYPGTNCEWETLYALRDISGVDAEIVWHESLRGRDWDAIVIPGGFSYGDYGRAGLIASWSRAAGEIVEAIDDGIPVLGICNGFQVLVEIGALPGALLANESGRFVARWVRVRIHRPRGPWLLLASDGQEADMPIAHAEGRYYHEDPSQAIGDGPWLEYERNPNGSVASIAGLAAREGQVLGLMPHPERAAYPWQAPRGLRTGGRVIFESIRESLRRGW